MICVDQIEMITVRHHFKLRDLLWTLSGLALLAWLYWLGGRHENYLLFHVLVESFSIVVGFSIFVIAWNVRRNIDSAFFSTLGMALLPACLMQLLHTLAYKNMAVFHWYAANQSNLATQLWLGSRGLLVAGLLTAAITACRRPRPAAMLIAFSAALVLLGCGILWWRNFPMAYDDAAGGITRFKLVSEWAMMGLMAVSLAVMLVRRALDRRVTWMVSLSVVMMILASAAFTMYGDPYGPMNRLGHLLNLVAFFLVYRGLVQTGLRLPYTLLFRHLRLSQLQLQQAQQELEERVHQRTIELKRAIEQLEQEVRDRIEAQEALRQSEQKFRHLVEHLPAITYVSSLEPQREVLYVSPQIEHLLGHSPDDFDNNPALWSQIVHPDDRDRSLVVPQAQQQHTCEYRLLARDGSEYWVRDESRVIYDQASQPLFLQGFLVDITARKRQQRELAEVQERFASFMRHMPGAAYLKDDSGAILYVNEQATQLLGGYAQRYLDRRTDAFDDPQAAREAQEDDRQVIHHNQLVSRIEHLRSNGQRLTCLSYKFPVPREGKPPLLGGICVDMTAQKNLERQVIEASETERRNIGRTLHDTLGQNLTGLAFLIKGLSRKLSQQSPHEVAVANQIVELVNEAVGQVRSIARGLDPIGLEREGLASSLQELCRNVRDVFGIDCEFQMEGVSDLSQEAASHLYYIAQEAVNNALKHSKATSLRLRLERVDSLVKLQISDDGVGLAPGIGRGNGMGMHIMRYRARAVGGTLSVHAGQPSGTVVLCVTPVAQEAKSTV